MFKEDHIIICGFPRRAPSEMGKARQPVLGTMGLKKLSECYISRSDGDNFIASQGARGDDTVSIVFHKHQDGSIKR